MVYAVRKGTVTGKFYTWDECKLSVNGVSGSEYKKFVTESEADDYLNHIDSKITHICTDIDKVVAKSENEIRVRGTYCNKTNCYAYGAILTAGNREIKLHGAGSEKTYISSKQIAGEVQGVLASIEMAISLKLESVTVVYRSQILEKVVTGEWTMSSLCLFDYANKISEYKKTIEILFRKAQDDDYTPYMLSLTSLSKTAILAKSRQEVF